MYGIRTKRHYLTGTYNVDHLVRWHWLGCIDDDAPLTFATRAEALAHVELLQGGRYDLAHGEYGRPDYRVRKISEKGGEEE